MDGTALLMDWPTFGKANAETLFASPAWRLEADSEEGPVVLTKAEARLSDLLWVEVSLEDEPHTLGIGDSEAYPDLHLLWTHREALPREVLLALVERECGGLFQVLEKAFRRQLKIKGLADDPEYPEDRRTDFQLTVGGAVQNFALDLSPLLITDLGKFRYLDTGHESVRALRRPAWVEYAAIGLLTSECAALAPGDCLVIPEEVEPAWRVTLPEDDLVHVRSEAAGEVTFAQLADGDMPALPEPGRTVLLREGRAVAKGFLEGLGLQRVFKVEEVIDHV